MFQSELNCKTCSWPLPFHHRGKFICSFTLQKQYVVMRPCKCICTVHIYVCGPTRGGGSTLWRPNYFMTPICTITLLCFLFHSSPPLIIINHSLGSMFHAQLLVPSGSTILLIYCIYLHLKYVTPIQKHNPSCEMMFSIAN